MTGVRLAGSTVAGLISLTLGLPSRSTACPPHAPRPAAQPVLPAGPVPVPAVFQAGIDPVGGPGDQVRRARHDLLVTAWAAVSLRAARTGLLPHHPVSVRP